MKYVKALIIIVVSIVFFTQCARLFFADVNYEFAQRELSDLNFAPALQFVDRAIKLNPLEPNYYRLRARVFLSYAQRYDRQTQIFVKDQVLKDLQKAYDLNPNNLVTVRNIIPIYSFLAVTDLAKEYSDKNTDAQFFAHTKDFYKKVKNISPNDVGVYALLAKYEKRLGLTDEYSESVEKVRKLRPDLLEWYDSFK